ncbi:unnamed protein product [Mytilus coruscus]|uniref:COR domain-containing protein n=1 Tax=Mytilus coruscus TaxID=42192 RepID=A0A6J8AWG3_MYTCO|nr:unnamed protein product [Mytilus coruscus]
MEDLTDVLKVGKFLLLVWLVEIVSVKALSVSQSDADCCESSVVVDRKVSCFTLSEVAISRSLRQSEGKSLNMNDNADKWRGKFVSGIVLDVSAEVISSSLPVGGTSTGFELDGKLTDRDEKSSDIPASQDFTSSTADSSHCIPFLSLNEITLANDLDIIDRIEVVNDALLEHGEIPRDEVIYIRSENDQGLVQDKDLPNQYSSSLDDIRKADVFIEKQTKTKGTKETFPVIPRESAEEAQRRAKQVATPLIDQLETIENSSDEHMVPLNESPDSAKEKGEFSHAESHSKPHIKSQEIGTTTEVVKDRGIIGKLKKLFGVQKDVTEIKVSMTKDKFLKESIKAGKKKLHQKKIAPVIIWDFGGQDVFYSTHQTFLTYRAIYLIVLDGSRTLDDPCPFEQYLPGKSGGKTARDYLRFWINTIVTYCKGSGPGFPKIMIVLTHKDKLEAEEVEPRRQQIFHDIEMMFSGSLLQSHLVIKEQIFVNAKNKCDPEMAKIKKIIIEQSMEQPTWGQKLPKCFIPLELEFDSLLSRNIPLITMKQMKKINSLQPVRPLTEQELKVFLKFQHSVGRILYFDEANLDQHIILSPTHLIDAFKSIVTDRRFCEGDRMRQESWDLMSRTGIMEKKSIEDIWKKKRYNKFQDHKEYLLGVMTHLDILVEPKRYDKTQKRIPAEFYYVASMVRSNDTTGYLMSPTFTQSNIAIAFSHSSSMIPPALSFRFISYCLSIFAVKKYGQKDDEMLFHRSAVFNIDQSLDMCVNCDDEIIVVRLAHLQNRTLIMRDLASSIRECLAVALEKISQLYVKTSSTDFVASKSSFRLSLCCSSFNDPCLLPISTLQEQDGSWICPKHGIEHTKDMMSWAIQKEEVQCRTACPVTDTEFLDQTPSDIHLRRLSMQYSINETKELANHLGMENQTWDDMYVTFGEEPERLKFEALLRSVQCSNLTFNNIKQAVEFGKIQTIHSLCKVVRGNPIDFEQEPEKWDLVPTEEHLDRVAPLVGNNSLPFLVELGLEFRTWEEIKYRQRERDLVKLNRHILQEWKSNFCSLHNIRPSLRDIGKAFNNIGKNIRIIENVLADLL